MNKSQLRFIIKNIIKWLLPRGIHDLISNYNYKRSQILSLDLQLVLNRNAELKDLHRGDRCFILATGPSIRTQDLKALKDEFCISVSNFFLHSNYKEIKPKYHCTTAYHLPIPEEGWQAWLNELAVKTIDSTLFFDVFDLKRNQVTELFTKRSIYYLHGDASLDSFRDHRIDLSKQIISPASVPVMALQIALYMGFRKIYLLGCDHDWILNMDYGSHCYDEKEDVLVQYGFNEKSNFDRGIQFIQQAGLWKQYKVLKLNAEFCGAEIFNATPGGLLDVFPRVNFESLFKTGLRTV